MKRASKAGLIVGAVVVVTGASMGLASAVGGEDSETDTAITGEALDKAEAAALKHTGGGEVTGTEVGDEESYYEVEVTLPSGEETDVQLNKSFEVVSSEVDSPNED